MGAGSGALRAVGHLQATDVGAIGREIEVRTIAGALRRKVPAVVVGVAGSGKSSVALAAATGLDRSIWRGAALEFLSWRSWFPIGRAIGRELSPGDADAIAVDVAEVVGEGVLILDDMQWTDPDSTTALAALAQRVPLLVSLRPGHSAADDVCRVMGEAGAITVELGPLDDRAAATLVRRENPTLSAGRIESILAQAGGVPMLLVELARRGGTAAADLRSLLQVQLDEASPAALCALARVGLSPECDLAEAPPGVVAELVRRGLARLVDGNPEPASHLLCEVALDRLGPNALANLHHDAANRSASVLGKAIHLEQAGEGSLAYSLIAPPLNDDGWSPTERATAYEIAARTAPDGAAVATALRAVGPLLSVNAVDRAREVLARVSGVVQDDRAHRAAWLYHLAQIETAANDRERSLELVQAGLDELEGEGTAASDLKSRLLALRARVHLLGLDSAAARRDLHEADRLCPDRSADWNHTRYLLEVSRWLEGEPEWRRTLPEMVEQARIAGQIRFELDASLLLVYLAFFSGDHDLGSTVAETAIGRARESRLVERATHLRGTLAAHQVLTELRPRQALATLLELVGDPAANANRAGHVTLASIALADLGEIGRARELASNHLQATADHNPIGKSSLHWALAEVELLDLRPARALEHAEAAMTIAPWGQPAHQGARAVAAWAAFMLGREVPAPSDRPLPLGSEAVGLELRAIAALTEGTADSAELFATASAQCEVYLRRNQLRCQWGLAEAHRRAGRTDDAEVHDRWLTLLISDSGRGGFELWRSRGRMGSQHGPLSENTFQLTEREQQVLGLVERGWTTTAIARFLHLSPSTVNAHARSAGAKLHTRRRTATALIATSPGHADGRHDESPLAMVVNDRGEVERVIHAFKALGWDVCPGWSSQMGPCCVEPSLDGASVCFGPVHDEADAQAVFRVVLGGSSVLISAEKPGLFPRLLDNLRRAARVHDWREGTPPWLTAHPDAIRLAIAVGRGLGIEAAARQAGMSRRTAYRRCSEAAACLGTHGPVATAHRLAQLASPFVPSAYRVDMANGVNGPSTSSAV